MSLNELKVLFDVLSNVGLAGLVGWVVYEGMKHFSFSLRPLKMTNADRARHRHIMGTPGTGKSTLIKNMVLESLESGRGVIVNDPHGTLAKSIANFVPRHRLGDVIYNYPLQYILPLNPLQLYTNTSEEQEFVIEALVDLLLQASESSMSHNIEELIYYSAWAMFEAKDKLGLQINPWHIIELATDEDFRREVLRQINNDIILSFFEDTFEQMPSTTQAAVRRLRVPMLSPILFKTMTGRSTVNYKDIMQNKQILINDFSGLGPRTLKMLYRVHVVNMQQGVMARYTNSPYCDVYMDEMQYIAKDVESLDRLLEECRKFNVSLTLAHHHLEQFDPELKKSVWMIGSHYFFQLGHIDARQSQPVVEYSAENPRFRAKNLEALPNFTYIKREKVWGKPRPPQIIRGKRPPQERQQLVTVMEQTKMLYAVDVPIPTRNLPDYEGVIDSEVFNR